MNKIFNLFLSILLLSSFTAFSQITSVGSGSYTTVFPGVDAAARNSFPTETPQLSGNVAGKPVPTNDWWSAIIKEDHTGNMFNYPMALKTTNNGLIVSYIPWGVWDAFDPIQVGTSNLNADRATVSDYSDWTVTLDWNDGTYNFQATTGIGLPFIYFTKADNDVAEITVNTGTATISNEMLIIENAHYDADFVVYAPSGSTWTKSGSTYTSTLNGQNYWSMAMLPLTASNVATVANEYKKYAYVFPTNTTADWSVDKSTSKVTTTFTVATDVKEGSDSDMLIGLLPHQWANLASTSAQADKYSYTSVRGELKTLAGNSFIVENTYKGILPTLPYLSNYSETFSPFELDKKISQIENDGLATWTDSYNEGQVMNRLIQTARIADQMGNTEARDKMIATVKERLEDWLTAESGEIAFLFYYNSDWSAMIGYPAGHGQDGNLNDHHFHWGYFIHAAAFMEQFEPGWAEEWGAMINLLVRDAASSNRNDDLFPFLRNFSPYAGHCWANGFATFPQGNDQESTSESMQFNSSLIHWGTITGNDSILDLGIYLYTTEQTAIEEYWFDMYERNFKANQEYSLVSRVWCNSYDNGTFWTSDIAASYGIEMYPIHGGSLYLGHNKTYVEKLWNEIKANTGILNNEENPNLWHDVMWEYLAFIDPETAIDMYNSNPDRALKFGISDAQTYHWLHSMNAVGSVSSTITADYPVAATFDKDGVITYVAHNYSNSPITVTFSDGYELLVPANKMTTNKDINATGVLSSDFTRAYANGSVNLSLEATGTGITKIEFYNGNKLIGTKTESPYTLKAENLAFGVHGLYAKIYEGEYFNVSNIIAVQVGEQVPFLGAAFNIPGVIEAGNYDKFEGGVGQDISYYDVSQSNNEDYRTDEYVDATNDNSEGKYVGHISSGEWLEYTMNVEESGLYSFAFRYASGNPSGGGPFILSVDGDSVSNEINVPSTSSTTWDVWASKTVEDIPLTIGEHILRISFAAGEFNLGKMTFARTGDVPYSFPIASAGDNVKVLWPTATTVLNGTASSESGNQALSYTWNQIYGPSVVEFSDNAVSEPTISSLVEGVYRFQLIVTNPDQRTSSDEVLVIVSSTENIAPNVSLTSPTDGSTYPEGKEITLSANASDLDGTIQKVEFYQNDELIGSDDSAPYSLQWTSSTGEYIITAKATDDGGAVSVSQPLTVSFLQVLSCSENSDEAQQGSFSVGYKVLFETVGTDVTVTFELYDDKDGLVAYLWTESPFAEQAMNHVEGKIFSAVLTGQTPGSTISVACKFAFAGGQAVTKYISYTVGDDCESDNENPSDFTATFGEITQTSIELLLNANDNSGALLYNITYGGTTKSATAESGVAISYVAYALKPNTNYSFSVTVSDNSGNQAANNPIELSTSTLESTNTACNGTLADAAQGAFTMGYNYSFETSGSDVNITFELLDDKSGVEAFLWNTTSDFVESAMTNNNGVFSTTLSGQTEGTVLKLACKFAFEGGLSVTKELSYTVGDNCLNTSVYTDDLSQVLLYPNPVINQLFIQSGTEIQEIAVYEITGQRVMSISLNSSATNIDLSKLNNGTYLVTITLRTGQQSFQKIVKQ
ncbi:MAG: glycosyl hydrolase [Salinivirgaceae bacterium]|jgi:endo-1,3(4)-beta-glucanase|nr:glycosyl hydrolase [Salinivirgaceae bacterium]